MVQAYLGKPNYTNAMNTALRTRLAYDIERDRRRGRGGGGGGGGGGSSRGRIEQEPSGTTTSADVKADADQRREYRESQADIAATEATTAAREKQTNMMGEVRPEEVEKTELANKMSQSKIEDAGVDRMKTVLDNALQYLPQVDQTSYGDWVGWIDESETAPRGVFKSAEQVENMSDVEWKVYHSKLEAMREYDPKKLKAMVTDRDKEEKKLAGQKKLLEGARDDYVKFKGLAEKLQRTGGLSAFELMLLPDKDKKELAGKSVDEQVALLNKRADLINADYPDLGLEDSVASDQPGGWKEYQ